MTYGAKHKVAEQMDRIKSIQISQAHLEVVSKVVSSVVGKAASPCASALAEGLL